MPDSSSTLLESLVTKAQRLCSLPAVAMKVLELTANPQIDSWAIKECIENDPALTSRILRVVNSSLFGLSREVCDLNQALALLGTKPLKLLVLGFSLPGNLFAGVSREMLGQYWRRTLTKAVAARELTQLLWQAPGDEAFIGGLLQDLGILLLIQDVGDPYVRFMNRALDAGVCLTAVEMRSLGFDHTMLSARLLEHWRLPEILVEAVGWHPEQQAGNPQPGAGNVPEVVYLAGLVTRLLVDRQAEALRELLELGAQHYELTESDLETLVAHLEEKVNQLADVLSLELPPGTDYADVLAQSQAQLAEIAASAAGDLVRFCNRLEQSARASLEQEIAAFSLALREQALPAPAAAVVEKVEPAAPRASAVTEFVPVVTRRSPVLDGPSEQGVLSRLQTAVGACRQARCPLSLLLIEFNQYERLLGHLGQEGFERMRRAVGQLCWELDHPGMSCLPNGDAGFALVLPHCDRHQAARLGNSLMDRVRQIGNGGRNGWESAFAVGVGSATVALPPKNFLPADLVAAAGRCLYASHATAGSVVKSIEIY